ncbi:MAG TPA: hypothetical protein VF100_06770, partial [Thermoanaerobaculia bacterium]
ILMQRRLVARIAAHPDARVPWLRHEVWFFLPAWLVLPFVALGRGLGTLWKLLTRLARKGRAGDAAPAPPAEASFAAASLGPSFLLGGAATAALFLLALLAGQGIAWRQGLPQATPPWQSVLLGARPELAAYLPLERRAPWLAALLLVLLWGTVWWWCSRLVRLVSWRHLGGSLHRSLDDPHVLPPWREAAEARRLIEAARPYRLWSGTLLVAAVPLAAMAWLALGAVPYRVGPAEMAVAAVLGLAWATNLLLRGAERGAAEAPETREPTPHAGAGWPEVREDLDRRLQLPTPLPIRAPRPLPVLAPAEDPAADPLLSPLLAELLPPAPDGPRGLTAMQRRELDRLARLGHVFTRPPAAPGELRLGGGDGGETGDGVRERNRVVLAPEGSGKSTLGILAAANHALVHTRSTLLVLRDEAAADALYGRIVARVDRSTLRWNLRVRRVGDDLAGDLAQGIVPDVLVTSLHQLVVGVLDQVDLHARLLRNVGLIVVDDAESYAGGVEAHAQLAFRRLALACRKLSGVEQLGDHAAPLVLALATDGMHQTGAWIGGLCGIDSEVERYGPPGAPEGGEGSAPPRQQEVYRLGDFRTATGERLDVAELVESCERLGVAWCYRRAADGERHLGRAALLLKDEPSWAVDDPLDAAVVLIEGAWSAVQREIDRLALAG